MAYTREMSQPDPGVAAGDAADVQAHAGEVAAGERFRFGANWRRFLAVVDDERLAQAEASLRDMLGCTSLEGKRFLDVGSGSGLFSAAARRLGAQVHSFDYDPDSVECTRELRRRFFPEDAHWAIEAGSVLDAAYVRSLGGFDVVYSWGVLHHTGKLWQALENVWLPTREGSALYLGIYNDAGLRSRAWRAIKRTYCSGALGRLAVLATFVPLFALRGAAVDVLRGKPPWSGIAQYSRNRGMSAVHDWSDWLGGYPYEFATPEAIFDFYRARGLELERLRTRMHSQGINEFVFRRRVR